MRITFLLPSDNLTGGNRVVAINAQELVALGHQVLVDVRARPLRPARQGACLLKGDWARLSDQSHLAAGHIAQSGVPHKVLERPLAAADVPDADVIIVGISVAEMFYNAELKPPSISLVPTPTNMASMAISHNLATLV